MPLEKPMEKEQGWEPLQVPEMHQWDKPGSTVSGKLVSITRIEVKGKPVVQYILATGVKDPARIKFLATYDLAQKLTTAHKGMLVRIKYLGEDETVKSKGNAMKVFDVHVKPDPNAVPEGRDTGPITDEDIPW